MLSITIPGNELYDEDKNEFIVVKECSISLEHSLVSLSKWESSWNKPFLSKETKTREEEIDYVRCMTLTQNVPLDVYTVIDSDIFSKIVKYIEAPMTATSFTNIENRTFNREIITSEIIYYWMVSFNIPWEAQKWHLNRLLTLINVCNIKNQPPKKMSRNAIVNRNAALNAARREKFNTNG